MNNILKRIANLERLLKQLINSNQLRRLVVQDRNDSTISIKVYDAFGNLRVLIGKSEDA